MKKNNGLFKLHLDHNEDIGIQSSLRAKASVWAMRMKAIKEDLADGSLTEDQALGIYAHAKNEANYECEDRKMEKLLDKNGKEYDTFTGKPIKAQ